MKIYKFYLLLLLLMPIYAIGRPQKNTATDSVLITTNVAIVSNLTPISEVAIYKSNFFNDTKRMTKKAEEELRKQAAQKRGNIIYVTKSEFESSGAGETLHTTLHMVGTLYKGDVAALTQQAEKEEAKNGRSGTRGIEGIDFKVTNCRGNKASQSVTVLFEVTNVTYPDIKLRLMNGWNSSPVAANDINMNPFKCKSLSLGSLTKTDMVQSELASGLKIKGSIVLSNVLPTTAQLYHISIPMGIADWDGEDPNAGFVRVQMSKYGTFDGNNIPIDWSGKAITDNTADTTHITPDADALNQVKNIDNNIDFAITGCTGDPNSQRVTVSFVFSNPRKVNQRITLSSRSNALDDFSTSFPSALIKMATETAQNDDIEKELPYGLQLKGSITFANILPTVRRLALMNLQTTSSNWDGGSDSHEGVIEVRNVKINWIVPKPIVPKKSNTH